MDPYDARRPVVDPVAPASPYVQPAVVRTTAPWSRAVQLVWLAVGVVVGILALDFLLRLFGANPVGFAEFIYSIAAPLVSPFVGIFGNSATDAVHVVRWADVIAVVVYALAGWLVARLLALILAPRRTVV